MSDEIPYVLVALLDVLGYRDHLARDRDGNESGFKDALQRAMQVLSHVNEAEYGYQAISDTIIVTRSDPDDLTGLLRVLKRVQVEFLRQGLLIRGAVTYERHFKSNNITYSHALAIAHQLEKEIAIYPRIVVDHNVIEMYEEKGLGGEVRASKLLCECNGIYFLNILDPENWADVLAAAKALYGRDRPRLLRREAEFLKQAWFEDYLFGSPCAGPATGRYIRRAVFLQ